MQSLSDEELKAAIETGCADCGYLIVDADTEALFTAIRKAERKNGDVIEDTQAYADNYAKRVLEVATPLSRGSPPVSTQLACWSNRG